MVSNTVEKMSTMYEAEINCSINTFTFLFLLTMLLKEKAMDSEIVSCFCTAQFYWPGDCGKHIC